MPVPWRWRSAYNRAPLCIPEPFCGSLSRFFPLARETVVFETPNASATSAMVISFFSSFSIVTSNPVLPSGVSLNFALVAQSFFIIKHNSGKINPLFLPKMCSHFLQYLRCFLLFTVHFCDGIMKKRKRLHVFMCQHAQNSYFL